MPVQNACALHIMNNIGAVYFMLANLDPALRSRLEAINLVALFKSDLLERYSLDDVLKPFITDLCQLSAVSLIWYNTA